MIDSIIEQDSSLYGLFMSSLCQLILHSTVVASLLDKNDS